MKQLEKSVKHVSCKIHPYMRLYILTQRIQPMPLTLPHQGFLQPPTSIPYTLTYTAQYHNRRNMVPGPVAKWA